MKIGKIRREYLGKFVLDLGKMIFAGTVVAQFFHEKGLSPIILIFGILATVITVILGLLIIPEEENL